MPYIDHATVEFEARFFITMVRKGYQDADRCRRDIEVRPEIVEHWEKVVQDTEEDEEVRSYFKWAYMRMVTFRKAVLQEFNRQIAGKDNHNGHGAQHPRSHRVRPQSSHYPMQAGSNPADEIQRCA